MELDRVLKVAVRGGASDVLLKTGTLPRFRLNGDLVSLSDGQEITAEIMTAWIEKILPAYLQRRLQTAGDVDFAYQIATGHRFRVNLFRQRQTFGMVLRVIHPAVKSLQELQMSETIVKLAKERRGLILITGATGSGKSTTLAGIVQQINNERAAHIITIEDPIEFNFRDACSTINQREIGSDSESFASAMRAALRQNPDVILVGELRDQQTTETALMAAETGHLVLSTLHTVDAVETMMRLLSYFPATQHSVIRQMLASTLKAVVSQRLVPRSDGKGMVAAQEILIINANARELILKAESFSSLHAVITNGLDQYGMCSFDDSLLSLLERGEITREEALTQSSNRDNMLLQMSGITS